MLFSTLVSYLAGLGFLRWSDPWHRRLCMAVPVTVDLALLAFFKYANFMVANVNQAFSLFGHPVALPMLNVVLPVGISFFGRAWSEPVLFGLAYSYEQATKHRRPAPSVPALR